MAASALAAAWAPVSRCSRSKPTGVVVVHVAVEQQPHVFELEPELADVIADLRHRLRQRAVDQDVPAVRRDQHRSQPARADPVGIAVHLERLLRLIPLEALLALILLRDERRREQRERASRPEA